MELRVTQGHRAGSAAQPRLAKRGTGMPGGLAPW
jgi:hypothetical protein